MIEKSVMIPPGTPRNCETAEPPETPIKGAIVAGHDNDNSGER